MLDPLLSDHGVLQRNAPVRLRGAGAPGERVEVRFRNLTASGVVDALGMWNLLLPPMGPGGPDDLTLTLGGQVTLVRDLLVGDIWVCSGQSNMDMALSKIDVAARELASAENPKLRLLSVVRRFSLSPRPFIESAGWSLSNAQTAANFSAVGFVFGQRLQHAVGVPVGLIMASVGETPCETWLSRAALEADGGYGGVFERVNRSIATYPDPDQTYRKAFLQWDHDADLAEREGRQIPGAHPRLIAPGDKWNPGACFNGMIEPLTHSSVKGVIWYQGAGAPDRAHQYRSMFRLLIRDWRKHWSNPSLPFYFVQEARFGPRREEPCEHSWGELREAQAMAQAEPHTAMAVAIDTGHPTDPHPTDKAVLGERLALQARAKLYGQDVAHESPVLAEMKFEGPTVRLRFQHAYGAMKTSDGRPPVGFALSGGATDFSVGHRGFKWASARIEGEWIVLSAQGVERPAAVRYAWAQNPDCNVINHAGLPLGPFRTDDWPGVTIGNC